MIGEVSKDTASRMERNGTTIDDSRALAARVETALASGDWTTAAAGYEALVRSHPEQVELKYGLARAYEELGRLQDAVDLLTDPSVAGRSKAKSRLARMYIKTKNYTAAMPLVRDLVAASPNNPRFASWKAVCEAKHIKEWLQEGQALEAAERLQEAEQLYLALLTEYPNTSRAFWHLGRLYVQQRRWADAIPPFRAGLAIDPGNIRMRMSLARALATEGMPADAIALLNEVEGGNEDAGRLFLLQRCHFRLQNWAQVDEIGARLLTIVPPDEPFAHSASDMRQDALVEIAAAGMDWLAECGHVDRALLGYRDIADQYPEAALAWMKLGKALAEAGHGDEAIGAFRTALNLRPGETKIRESLTRAVIETCDAEEVLGYVQDAIAEGTADAECHRWLAEFHNENHDWQSALENAQNAIAISPEHRPSRMLVARALMRLSRLAEALDELNAVLALGAARISALQLKADVFVRLARIDDAIDLYRQALEKVPDHPLINDRLSSALLLKGDIAGFHTFHEKRRNIPSFIDNNKDYSFSNWNGELPIEGKLLVWSESGFGVGQNILHMTFLKSLAALGLDVVFEVEPRLVELCRRSFPDLTVVATDGELPAGISHHTPIGSLSRWFKPDLASFETMRPYFLPDAQAVAAHRTRLQDAAGDGQILVGISWTSNNPFVGDVKSVPLDQLLNAIALPGVTLINLQYGDHSESVALAEAKAGKRLMDSGIDNSNDLDGLAAVVAAMDLVVCIGHTTAHMAGAVGTPNFVLLPAAPFPHWLAEGERCIWYPATTLFREAPVDDDWLALLQQVRGAVLEFASRYDSSSWLATTLLPGLRPSSARAEPMSPREIRDAAVSFFLQDAYRSALQLMDRLPPEHLSRELEMLRGDMLALVGHWEEAGSLFLSLASEEGDDGLADRKLLSNSLAMYDLESALPLARQLADEEPAYRLIAANILYHLRRHEEALAELRALSIQAPQAADLSTLRGTILLEMGEFERAEAYLADQAAMTLRVDDYTLLGRAISAQGRHEDALAAYEKGLERIRHNPALNFWRTQKRIELGLVPLAPLPPLLGHVPEVTRDDVVIFFAADSSFFWQHGLVLIGSVGRRSPGAKCHVHVINPDTGVERAVEIIRSTLPDLNLSYSYEHVDFDGCSDLHIRTYYASVRFVRLAEIFTQSPAFYLCVDADSIVRHDVSRLQPGQGIADVAMYMRYHDQPHMAVLASASILRPTAAAAKFIDRVGTLIGRTLEAREAVWFLDQIVLGHVVRELGEGQVNISLLDRTYLDWFFHDDSLIWTGKGKRKSDDSRYRNEVSKYRYLQENEEIITLVPQSICGSDDAEDADDSL